MKNQSYYEIVNIKDENGVVKKIPVIIGWHGVAVCEPIPENRNTLNKED